VPLPTPPGPQTTRIRVGCCLEQRFALLGSEALEPAGLTYADVLHQAAGLDFAGARECLENRQHLHLADDLVRLRFDQQLAQGNSTTLQVVLYLGAFATRTAAFSSAAWRCSGVRLGGCGMGGYDSAAQAGDQGSRVYAHVEAWHTMLRSPEHRGSQPWPTFSR